ncbi:MAG: GNAT family N-acetyltransferase [Exiguobacterium sp.]|nr:GNAT family N-acetyltransferase [Exiguobacterium sp.]MBR3063490.1 GNAT family N-acetyltransferase [Exiguobacterium sp.]MBR3215239.1 GNAT family N-acetyltransferase [Exiguobacterium sp.]MBR3320920.1 GNAT family N-acetyltransferase [Exiguobacterium sp.]
MLEYKLNDDITLRMFNTDDADELFELTIASKPYLREWLGWLDYIETVEDSKRNIEGRIKGLIETGGRPKSFALMYKGALAGTIGFNEIDRSIQCGTIGYWLGQEFQGKGIMSQALEVIIEYGFRDLKLNKIEIRVATENVKSRALPERFGFTEEGVIRDAEWLYDHYVDHVVYGLLQHEYLQLNHHFKAYDEARNRM